MKYWDKNLICIKEGINFCTEDNSNNPLKTFVKFWENGEITGTTFLNMYFQCCDKANTPPRKIFFEQALKLCDDSQERKQLLKPIIQQHFEKYYPNDHKVI